MQLPEPLLRAWCVAARYTARTLTMGEDGLILGKTLLAPFQNGKLTLDKARIAALLTIACGTNIPRSILKSIYNAERCYRAGNTALANMHLALTGIQAIDLEKAQRLFAAEWSMNNGVTPRMLLKIAGIRVNRLRKDDEDDEDDLENGDFDAPGSEADDDGGTDDDFNSKHPR